MTGLVCIRREQQLVTPWQNGGGSTRQIAIDPPGASLASGFRWRVSQAQVASDGPFSHLPGIDRSLWLVRGRGLRLTMANEVVVLDHRWQRLDFAGETAVHAQLLDGPCEDLNVMTSRDAVQADARIELVAAHQSHRVRAGAELVVVLEGEVQVREARLLVLVGDALRVPPGMVVDLAAGAEPATVLAVAFAPRA